MSTSSASIKPMPVVASSTAGPVNAWATITPDRLTPRWSFFQPRWPRPPCFAAAHSPSPTIERPVLSTMSWMGSLAGTWCSSTVEMPAPARQRGVVGRFEIDVHYKEDRPQEALRLVQGQPEDEPERQRGRDREIREPLLAHQIDRTATGATRPLTSVESHSVTSPRCTSARSYAHQFRTRYFVLYVGYTFDFIARSCAAAVNKTSGTAIAYGERGGGAVHQTPRVAPTPPLPRASPSPPRTSPESRFPRRA